MGPSLVECVYLSLVTNNYHCRAPSSNEPLSQQQQGTGASTPQVSYCEEWSLLRVCNHYPLPVVFQSECFCSGRWVSSGTSWVKGRTARRFSGFLQLSAFWSTCSLSIFVFYWHPHTHTHTHTHTLSPPQPHTHTLIPPTHTHTRCPQWAWWVRRLRRSADTWANRWINEQLHFAWGTINHMYVAPILWWQQVAYYVILNYTKLWCTCTLYQCFCLLAPFYPPLPCRLPLHLPATTDWDRGSVVRGDTPPSNKPHPLPGSRQDKPHPKWVDNGNRLILLETIITSISYFTVFVV